VGYGEGRVRYQVKVLGKDGALVCGVTLHCHDAAATPKSEALALPPGTADLNAGARRLAPRQIGAGPARTAA
jgi:hypothetical protein